MPDVVVVGDGPAGWSAALFLAKNDLDTLIVGPDQSAAHNAYFYNFPGIDEIDGSALVERWRRQATSLGAEYVQTEVERVDKGDQFRVTAGDDTWEARYVVIAAGNRARHLLPDLDVELNDINRLVTDRDGRTSVEGLYAAGWAARGDKIQAVISAGEGAACALDILSKEAGKPVRDFDMP